MKNVQNSDVEIAFNSNIEILENYVEMGQFDFCDEMLAAELNIEKDSLEFIEMKESTQQLYEKWLKDNGKTMMKDQPKPKKNVKVKVASVKSSSEKPKKAKKEEKVVEQKVKKDPKPKVEKPTAEEGKKYAKSGARETIHTEEVDGEIMVFEQGCTVSFLGRGGEWLTGQFRNVNKNIYSHYFNIKGEDGKNYERSVGKGLVKRVDA